MEKNLLAKREKSLVNMNHLILWPSGTSGDTVLLAPVGSAAPRFREKVGFEFLSDRSLPNPPTSAMVGLSPHLRKCHLEEAEAV
jgi:hypothetical protein